MNVAPPVTGLENDLAAVLLCNAVSDRESQAGAHARWLGGEKRLEDSTGDFLGHARTVVRHFNRDALPGDISGANPDPASAARMHEGLLGVHQ